MNFVEVLREAAIAFRGTAVWPETIIVKPNQSKAISRKPRRLTTAISAKSLDLLYLSCMLKIYMNIWKFNNSICLLKTLLALIHNLERGKQIPFALGTCNCWWSTSPKHFPIFLQNNCSSGPPPPSPAISRCKFWRWLSILTKSFLHKPMRAWGVGRIEWNEAEVIFKWRVSKQHHGREALEV